MGFVVWLGVLGSSSHVLFVVCVLFCICVFHLKRQAGEDAIQYNVRYDIILRNIIQYNTIRIQNSKIQNNPVHYNTEQFSTLSNNTIRYNAMKYSTVQYDILYLPFGALD